MQLTNFKELNIVYATAHTISRCSFTYYIGPKMDSHINLTKWLYEKTPIRPDVPSPDLSRVRRSLL